MTDFIFNNGEITPTTPTTPSERRAHRATGPGFIITARDENTLRRCLNRYWKDNT